jgi:hypothetical protein
MRYSIASLLVATTVLIAQTGMAKTNEVYWAFPDHENPVDERCPKLEKTTLEQELSAAGARLVRPAMRDENGGRFVYAINRLNLPLALFESKDTCLRWHRAAFPMHVKPVLGNGVWRYVPQSDASPRTCTSVDGMTSIAEVPARVMVRTGPFKMKPPKATKNGMSLVEVWDGTGWVPEMYFDSEDGCLKMSKSMENALDAVQKEPVRRMR